MTRQIPPLGQRIFEYAVASAFLKMMMEDARQHRNGECSFGVPPT